MSDPNIMPLRRSSDLQKVNLRYTHPNLYRGMMAIAITQVLLGLNFLLTVPTFQQYGIPKNLIGAGFLALGLSKLVCLNWRRNLKAVRVLMICGMTYMLFWGVGTTQTAFAGESSFQLFILYVGLTALQAPLLLEPFFNPVTANGKPDE